MENYYSINGVISFKKTKKSKHNIQNYKAVFETKLYVQLLSMEFSNVCVLPSAVSIDAFKEQHIIKFQFEATPLKTNHTKESVRGHNWQI